jgi:hypothetical protein
MEMEAVKFGGSRNFDAMSGSVRLELWRNKLV